MSLDTGWPSLQGWDETKEALHAYAKVAGAPARVLAKPHPKWWHVSLKVTEDGLLSDVLSKVELGSQQLRTFVNLRSHSLELLVDGHADQSYDLTRGESATALGTKLKTALSAMGIEVELPEEKYVDDEPRFYDPEMAQRYLMAVNKIDSAMKLLRKELTGDRGPVQLWPHHFDLAFEWFGTRTVTYEQNGEQSEHSAQLNFGFAPGDSSFPNVYFYSNPWPFEKKLTSESLPGGARWMTEGFEGTLLPYQDLLEAEQPTRRLLEYFRRVYELAKPTLMA